jgi:uncharacterized membrane protein
MSARTISVLASVAGLGVAGYMSYVQLGEAEAVCFGGGGCSRVHASDAAELAGVPVGLLGLFGYAALLALAFVHGEAMRALATLVALIGLGFSGYLTYVSIVEIEATCPWCLSSLALMTTLAVTNSLRLLRGDR